jgi:Ca2+-binding EF-hand superfamily protein
MKHIKKISLTIAAASVGLALAATPTLATQDHGATGGRTGMGQGMGGGMGQGNMMQMMKRMHTMMNGGGMHAGGMMGGGMGANMAFDTDGNGKVSPKEMRTGLMKEMKANDTDGNGTLSIEEFEVLHSARIRNKMVDRFQALDENGDGKVTEAEMTAPAKKLKMQMMRKSAAGKGNMQGGSTTPDNN